MSRNRIIAIIAILAVLAGLFTASRIRSTRKLVKSAEQIQKEVGLPVDTSVVQVGNIEDTVPVTGTITALDTTTLSPKIMGKVVYVAAREGDFVRKGQVMVQLDPTDAQAALRQALAGLEAAHAGLSQARTTATVTDVQSNSAIQQAKAALVAAQANLQKIRKGARSQERMIAENQVATAKANLNNAQANLKRYKQLFAQGAVAQAQLDVYQTQYDVALAQYNSAKENLSLVEEGARREDVRAAETQVTQAREALRAAKANAGQTLIRREDIKNAQAGVSQAEAQIAIAKEQVKNTSIRSSIDGYVSKRMTEPGQTATVGVPLMEVVNVKIVYLQADVSETVLAKVKPGQAVGVSVDAYQNETFIGKVHKIYPTASTTTRNFSVRVSIPNPGSKLKPGMFGRGSIVTSANTNVVLIPQDAIEERDGKTVVFTLKGNTAKMHTIVKGLSNSQFVEAVPPSDISAGDVVITAGHENLQDGAKVEAQGQK
ncbi:MAG: efflux RND transporter periplasmic adaptor subunit [Armatimonadota bacterium]